jgi:hypothetical protein
MGNQITKKYFRATVREMVRTYPLLAGLGITAGEGMPEKMDSKAKEAWLWDTYGEGVRDALKEEPKREFRMIHRFHWTAQGDILDAFKDYPGPFEFSFKYSVAHMYSITKPPFIQPLIENIAPGRKTWLTVRNDDIYTFRFGDPGYAREYILNIPPAEKIAGFYMGPDGYTWGRDFIERNPDAGKRPLVMEKQWYSFMLWGRLAYDPSLPDSHFEKVLAARHPKASSPHLFRALQDCVAGHAAGHALLLGRHRSEMVSRGLPEPSEEQGLLHRAPFHGRHHHAGRGGVVHSRLASAPHRPPADDGDHAARNRRSPRRRGSGNFRRARHAPRSCQGRLRTPEKRDRLRSAGLAGRYYASKIRGACALALFDVNGDKVEHEAALWHLGEAQSHWKRYAAIRDAHYVPALYNRVGYVNVTELTEKVAADLDIARNWKPGSLQDDGKRAGSEKGFRK